MMCEYKLTLNDYRAAQRLHIRSHARQRFTFLFWHRFMPLLGVVALGLLLWDTLLRHFLFPAWLGGLLAALSFAGLYPAAVRPFLIRRGFRTAVEGAKIDTPVQLELTEGELISRIPGRSEGRFLPAAIQNMVRDEQVCLIYVRKKVFLFVPRDSMSEELWKAIGKWAGKDRAEGRSVNDSTGSIQS